MMKKFQTILCVLSLVWIGGCSDFLEEASQDEVIVRTVSDFSELLLGSGYPDPFNDPLLSVLYVLDDDAEQRSGAIREEENHAFTNYFGAFTWQPDLWERVAKVDECYSGCYERIMGCNAVLDGIDDAIGETESRERVKAEALAVRAYFYFLLVNTYGEPYNENPLALGVPLKLTAGIVENGVRRNTVGEVYDQIVTDLSEASALLKKYTVIRGDFRINYPAVNILLARAYLFMERWEDAIAAASCAIEAGGNLTNYTQVAEGESFYLDYTKTEVEWIYGSDNRYSGMIGLEPARELYLSYDKQDRRRDLYFGINKYFDEFMVRKMTSEEGDSPSNALRISEAYLTRAEAYANDSKTGTLALADLNKLRRNRIIGYQEVNITDPVQLLREIRQERRKELCYEELRWFDLRRYGMPSISHFFRTKLSDPGKTYTLREKDPMYTLPIPNEIIVKNRLLEQNASAKSPIRQGKDK